MPEIGPRVALAHTAWTIWIERARVTGVTRLLDRDFAFGCIEQTVPSGAGREHAVHHVYAKIRIFRNLLWRSYSHQIARFVFGKMFDRGLDDLASEFTRLAYAKSADGISVEANLYGAFGRFLAQSRVHAALDDAEECLGLHGMRRGRCPHPPSQVLLGVSWRAERARPDEGVRA